MAASTRAPKFHRRSAPVRREALVEATLKSLMLHGHEGTSIRRISATAGVSIGLINHHFENKSELIAAAYAALAASLQESIRRRCAEGTPRERLGKFLRASFTPDIVDPSIFNVWLVFWSMVMHVPEMRAVHDRSYHEYRSLLEQMLRAVAESGDVPPFKLRPAAIALAALLDGLWIELCLSPATFGVEEAIRSCDDWLSALCSGALPGLLIEPSAATFRRSAKARTAR
jgi:AcrR family transcriptional regulator